MFRGRGRESITGRWSDPWVVEKRSCAMSASGARVAVRRWGVADRAWEQRHGRSRDRARESAASAAV